MTDFLHNHPWIANFVLGFMSFVSVVTLNQILGGLTIILTLLNIFFQLRDKWWRDPVRKAKRNAARRRVRK